MNMSSGSSKKIDEVAATGASKKKRSYHFRPSSSSSSNVHPASSKRGAPGVLLTCYRGRENKCRQEALDMLEQDWEDRYHNGKKKEEGEGGEDDHDRDNQKEAPMMSLEDELATIRQSSAKNGRSRESSPFTEYETGTHGVIVLLATGSKTMVMPPPTTTQTATTEPEAKKARVETTTTTTNNNSADDSKKHSDGPDNEEELPLWDPVQILDEIFRDTRQQNRSTIMNSRYIMRMLPLQATCYAALDDIQHVVRQLLQPVASTKSTFAITFKRRNCAHLKRDQVIDAVGGTVEKTTSPTPWSVKLKSPDYTIMIEICKSLAGISLCKGSPSYNLAKARGGEDKESSP